MRLDDLLNQGNAPGNRTLTRYDGLSGVLSHLKPFVPIVKQLTTAQVELLNLKTINFAYQEIYSCSKYAEADDWMKGLGRWSTTGHAS